MSGEAFVLITDESYVSYTFYVAYQLRNRQPESQNYLIFVILDDFELNQTFQGLVNSLNIKVVGIADNNLQLTSHAQPHLSRATLLKALIPQLLPNEIKKIIYLDSDTLLLDSFTELFDLDFGGAALLASRDASQRSPLSNISQYFNAGVLVIRRTRDLEHKFEQVFELLIDTQYPLLDQDVLNVVFQNEWQEIDECYNYQLTLERTLQKPVANFKIIHFIGPLKPWLCNISFYHAEWRRGYSSFLKAFNLNCFSVRSSHRTINNRLILTLVKFTLPLVKRVVRNYSSRRIMMAFISRRLS